jgi:hypothetical protein
VPEKVRFVVLEDQYYPQTIKPCNFRREHKHKLSAAKYDDMPKFTAVRRRKCDLAIDNRNTPMSTTNIFETKADFIKR